jgi:[calcium/calmodulin-dependent protein kinase] kinase
MSASIVDPIVDPLTYDPVGEAPITSKLVTIKPELMLNDYKRVVKVGGGQHGTVYFCIQKREGAPPLAFVSLQLSAQIIEPHVFPHQAMKSVKRVNPRDKYELLRKGHLPRSPNGLSVADKVNTTEEKIRKEIAIMKKLRHPHVVRLYEVIDDRMREKIYIGKYISLP